MISPIERNLVPSGEYYKTVSNLSRVKDLQFGPLFSEWIQRYVIDEFRWFQTYDRCFLNQELDNKKFFHARFQRSKKYKGPNFGPLLSEQR